jgi:hypothetical protein
MSDGQLIEPRLVLECATCHHRPAPDSVLEALSLHFLVEHDTEDVNLNLIAVCTCGAAMDFIEAKPTGGGFFDWYRCTFDGNQGRIKREPRDGD